MGERKVAIVGTPTWEGKARRTFQCKRKCTDCMPPLCACEAFTYDQNTKVCSLYAGDVEVETVLPPISGFKVGKSGRCPAHPTTVPAETFIPTTVPAEEFIPTTEDDTDYCDGWGTRYTGPVISTLTDLHLNGQNGREECEKRCNGHGDCAAYSYKWMSCALLKSVDMVEELKGHYSGRKGCISKAP